MLIRSHIDDTFFNPEQVVFLKVELNESEDKAGDNWLLRAHMTNGECVLLDFSDDYKEMVESLWKYSTKINQQEPIPVVVERGEIDTYPQAPGFWERQEAQ